MPGVQIHSPLPGVSGNLTSRAPRGPGSNAYTWPGFYKTLWCIIIYLPESKCPNSLMAVPKLENWSSVSSCGYSKPGWEPAIYFWAAPGLLSYFLQGTGQTTTSTRRETWNSSILVHLTFSHFCFNSSLALCVYKLKV